ncbi:MAG: BatD family protein [Microscillaceae bacterium]|jgi:hypothetical protein|nr:BatD family protein [Microscillaceae bacterium]
MKQKKSIFSLNNYKILIISLLAYGNLAAQEMRIEVGKTKIALNEAFTISIESDGKEINDFGAFPEIPNFKKISSPSRATSQSSFSANGEVRNITTYIRTQTYHPQREGTFALRPFKIRVNGKDLDYEGLNIQVTAYDPTKGELEELNAEDFEDLLSEKEIKLIEVNEDAFLGLTINKNEVFVGEGFTVSLALYISAENRAPMQYFELGKQVEEIAKKLKPANCWEENFDIQDIPESPRLQINGKVYLQDKFYEATFFPFNNQAITFPRVGLQMKVKKKIDLQNPNEFSDKTETEIKTFYSNPRTVLVKQLPRHPLREKVAVGVFYLQEAYPPQGIATGESFKYTFQIMGEGNIAAIQAPNISDNPNLIFYASNTQQFINRGQGKVSGAILYEYQIIPSEAGKYALKNQIAWIFFNPNTARYDTLRPLAQFNVTGESRRNSEISTTDLNKFYQRIPQERNTLIDQSNDEWFKLTIKFILGIMLAIMLVWVIWHRGIS